jgi:hypothetical protein
MVTRHTASLMTAEPSALSQPPARSSRPIVSRMAVMDHSSAPVSAGVPLAFGRYLASHGYGRAWRPAGRGKQ